MLADASNSQHSTELPMTSHTRLAGLLLPTLVVATVVADPYSWYLNGSDARQAAPPFQLGVTILGLTLQVLVAILVVRGSPRVAASLAGAELLLAVSALVYLTWRDGYGRFEWGFGNRDFIWVVAGGIVLRVALVALLRASLRREVGGAPAPPA